MFKINKNWVNDSSKIPEGYKQVQMLRQYSADANEFDNEIKANILLDNITREDHNVWKDFQPKFMLTYELINYHEFFESCLYRVCEDYIKELVCVCEYRHIFGMLLDENGPLSMEREMAIFKRVEQNIRKRYDRFRIKIICCGLKILGVDHLKFQVKCLEEAADDVGQMITGIDLVNEEDYHVKTNEFLEVIYGAKERFGDKLKVVLHAGESNNRNNSELYDAVLLGAVRIGHGFNLAKHPKLIEMVKENNICLECCPVSNKVLGYAHDYRCHPMRGLINRGVQCSISSDDQGFWQVKHLTYDYLIAYVAWDLTLSDIRRMVWNSIDYSTCSEEDKQIIKEWTRYKWIRFLEYVRGRY